LETIFRLAKAVAKIRLKDVVDIEDVIHTIKFYNSLINNYLHSVAPVPKDPRNVIVETCKSILKDSKEPLLLTEIIKQVCIENDNSRSYLIGSCKTTDESKLKMENNKKIRTVVDLLRNDKNVMTINKNPIKLQYKDDDMLEERSDGSDGSDRLKDHSKSTAYNDKPIVETNSVEIIQTK
jgi:DNA replicative helicase MCM subunit Mcm2 (Cdc46/Mcm family)